MKKIITKTDKFLGSLCTAITLIALILTLLTSGLNAQNPYPPYDFTVENDDGDLLYYRITSATAPYTVAVTRCQDSVYYTLLEPQAAYQIGQPGYLYPLYDYDSAITVPATVTYDGTTYNVTSVDNEAFFMQKDLKSVTLPASVKTIQEKAFHRSGIYKITMPGVERIEENAFYSSPLAQAVLPSSLVYMGEAAFAYTSLSQVDIPSGLAVLPSYAFYGCPLTKITFHEGLNEIGTNAFFAEFVDSLVFPSTLQKINSYDWSFDPYVEIQCQYVEFKNGPNPLEIGGYCFYHFRKLETLILSDNVVSIGRHCFEGCGIKQVIIPSKVHNIQWYCFADCDSLQNVVLPENLANIETSAFMNTPQLMEITLPASVISVGNRAFTHPDYDNGGIKVINCYSENPFIILNTSFSNHDTIYVHVPCGTTETYRSATGWSSYSNFVYEECVGLEDYEPAAFKVWPNPANDVVNVECTTDNEQCQVKTVEMYDIYGKLVNTVNVMDNPIRVNVSALPAGVYVLRVKDADGREYQQKVVRR